MHAGHDLRSPSLISNIQNQNSTPQSLAPKSSTTPSSSERFTDPIAEMENRLQVRPPQEMSAIRMRAFEDARKVQAQVIEECKKKGKDPPPYVIEELIGKGSFGRVYKGYRHYHTMLCVHHSLTVDTERT